MMQFANIKRASLKVEVKDGRQKAEITQTGNKKGLLGRCCC